MEPRLLHRRSVLARGTGLLALLAVGGTISAGCSSEQDRSESEAKAVEILTSLLAAEYALLARYRQSPPPGLSPQTISALITDHSGHVEGITARLSAAVSKPSPALPGLSTTEIAQLSAPALEQAAALAAKRSCVQAPDIGDVAVLCASISACESSHLEPISGSLQDEVTQRLVLSSQSALAAAQRVLRAEHAAIYNYGVIGSQLPDNTLDSVHEKQFQHQQHRDILVTAISAQKETPVAAEVAYQIPFPVTDESSALRLAVKTEEQSGASWRAAIPALHSTNRNIAVQALAHYANNAAHWRRSANPNTTSLGTVVWPGV